MTWCLFLDDLRNPETTLPFGLGGPLFIFVARSTEEAKKEVLSRGMPSWLFLDHDLGGDDTSMVFLNWLANEYWDGESPIPNYSIHSQNPVGAANIKSFMMSWERNRIEIAEDIAWLDAPLTEEKLDCFLGLNEDDGEPW